MCEGVWGPDIADANRDVMVDSNIDADRDGSTDGSDDAFRPWPGLRDASRDADEPDGISWRPSPAPMDPPMFADALRLTVSSATAPTMKPDGSPWDGDGTAPDLRVDIGARGRVILATSVATNTYSAEFADEGVRIDPTESLRFVLYDVDELTPTGARTEIVTACAPRVTDEIRVSGGLLRCKTGDATIEVRAEALSRSE